VEFLYSISLLWRREGSLILTKNHKIARNLCSYREKDTIINMVEAKHDSFEELIEIAKKFTCPKHEERKIQAFCFNDKTFGCYECHDEKDETFRVERVANTKKAIQLLVEEVFGVSYCQHHQTEIQFFCFSEQSGKCSRCVAEICQTKAHDYSDLTVLNDRRKSICSSLSAMDQQLREIFPAINQAEAQDLAYIKTLPGYAKSSSEEERTKLQEQLKNRWSQYRRTKIPSQSVLLQKIKNIQYLKGKNTVEQLQDLAILSNAVDSVARLHEEVIVGHPSFTKKSSAGKTEEGKIQEVLLDSPTVYLESQDMIKKDFPESLSSAILEKWNPGEKYQTLCLQGKSPSSSDLSSVLSKTPIWNELNFQGNRGREP